MNAAVRAVLFGAVLSAAGCAPFQRPAVEGTTVAVRQPPQIAYKCDASRLPSSPAGLRLKVSCRAPSRGDELTWAISYAAAAAIYDAAPWVKMELELQDATGGRSFAFLELWEKQDGAVAAVDVVPPEIYRSAWDRSVHDFCGRLTQRNVNDMRDVEKTALSMCTHLAQEDLLAATKRAEEQRRIQDEESRERFKALADAQEAERRERLMLVGRVLTAVGSTMQSGRRIECRPNPMSLFPGAMTCEDQ